MNHIFPSENKVCPWLILKLTTSTKKLNKLTHYKFSASFVWLRVSVIQITAYRFKQKHKLVLPCLSSRLSRSLYPFFFTWIFTPKTRRDSSILKYLLPHITVGLKFSGHGLWLGESSISLISKHPLIPYISWRYFTDDFIQQQFS